MASGLSGRWSPLDQPRRGVDGHARRRSCQRVRQRVAVRVGRIGIVAVQHTLAGSRSGRRNYRGRIVSDVAYNQHRIAGTNDNPGGCLSGQTTTCITRLETAVKSPEPIHGIRISVQGLHDVSDDRCPYRAGLGAGPPKFHCRGVQGSHVEVGTAQNRHIDRIVPAQIHSVRRSVRIDINRNLGGLLSLGRGYKNGKQEQYDRHEHYSGDSLNRYFACALDLCRGNT